jgi:hypothetical protein
MFDAVPDLRDELRKAAPEELVLEAVDVTATYDKAEKRLHLAATVPGELVSENEKPRPPKGRASGDSFIAGPDSSLRATRGSRNGTGWRPSQGHESQTCHPPAAHGVWVPARRFCFSRIATASRC